MLAVTFISPTKMVMLQESNSLLNNHVKNCIQNTSENVAKLLFEILQVVQTLLLFEFK